MTEVDTTVRATDRLLSRRIAVLMRWGTLTATVLLIAGAILVWCTLALASSVAVVAGCGVLILLPVIRLLLMLISFARRADKPYMGITVLVLVFILTSAVTGMIL